MVKNILLIIKRSQLKAFISAKSCQFADAQFSYEQPVANRHHLDRRNDFNTLITTVEPFQGTALRFRL